MVVEALSKEQLPAVPRGSDLPDHRGAGGFHNASLPAFDYASLPPNVANSLSERLAQIRAAVKKTTETVIAIGRDLIAAKKILGHGRFVNWVEMECGFRIRTAQNYMVITRLSAKYEFVAYLPIDVVLRLARTRGRSDLLDKIAMRIRPERRLTDHEIRSLLEKFKKKRLAKPERQQTYRPGQLKPVERPSANYSGITKTNFARHNAEHLAEQYGLRCLLFFRMMKRTGTLDETLAFVETEIRRMQFDLRLAHLSDGGPG